MGTPGRPGITGGQVSGFVEERLVRAAQSGDQAASCELVKRYRALVCGKARSYFIVGADRDDIIQEGMIGLFKAIRDFDPSREATFRSFAELCVTRQVITAIKAATRQKHSPLNAYVSFSRPMTSDEEGERLFSDIIAAREICDPAEIVVGAWEARFIRDGMNQSLSGFERDVLRLYTDGRSYCEIARELGKHTKAVDNALQRIKRKVEVQMQRCHAS